MLYTLLLSLLGFICLVAFAFGWDVCGDEWDFLSKSQADYSESQAYCLTPSSRYFQHSLSSSIKQVDNLPNHGDLIRYIKQTSWTVADIQQMQSNDFGAFAGKRYE